MATQNRMKKLIKIDNHIATYYSIIFYVHNVWYRMHAVIHVYKEKKLIKDFILKESGV